MEDKFKEKIIELGMKKLEELIQLEIDMRDLKSYIRDKDIKISNLEDQNKELKDALDKKHKEAFDKDTEIKILENKYKDLEADTRLKESELTVKVQELEKSLSKARTELIEAKASVEVGKGMSEIYDSLKAENERLKALLENKDSSEPKEKPLDGILKRRGRPPKYER